MNASPASLPVSHKMRVGLAVLASCQPQDATSSLLDFVVQGRLARVARATRARFNGMTELHAV